MNNKYEIIKSGEDEARIRALRSFGDVKKGDIGGFIESEKNLSHNGDCWVYDNARVYGKALVTDNARVGKTAKISGNALVFDDALVICDVSGNAKVSGYAGVFGDCISEAELDQMVIL